MEEKNSFENNLNTLEDIVAKLDKGEETLENSIQLYEKGFHLVKACRTLLNDAELRIKKVQEISSDKIETVDIDLDSKDISES